MNHLSTKALFYLEYGRSRQERPLAPYWSLSDAAKAAEDVMAARCMPIFDRAYRAAMRQIAAEEIRAGRPNWKNTFKRMIQDAGPVWFSA